MGAYVQGREGQLYDPTTGELVGWLDSKGREQLGLNALQGASVAGNVAITRAVAAPPIAFFVGNSITIFGFETGSGTSGGYPTVSEQLYVSQFAGNAITRVASVTAGSFISTTGDYGHGAAILTGASGILVEMQSVAFLAWDASSIVPGLIIGHALTENDIATDVAAATIIPAIAAWVLAVQRKYPGVPILLCTNRPDGRLQNNPTRIACANSVRDYILSLENGASVFACNLSASAYLDPANPWTPLSGYTYAASTADAIGTISVHPRQNAASINGRLIAAAVRRITGGTVFAPVPMKSINDTLTGTTSVAGGKTSGTGPTSASISVQPTGAASTLVSVALQPGWQVTFTPDSGQSIDAFELRLAAYTPLKYPRTWAPYAVVKIVSGSASIVDLDALEVVTYTTGTPGNQTRHMSQIGAFSSPTILAATYADGDLIYCYALPTAYSAYVAPTQKPATFFIDMRCNVNGQTPVVLQVQAMGTLFFDQLPIAAGISVTASPFQYFCPVTGGNQKVIVTPNGATISDISIGTNVSALFSTGLIAGMFALSPGDVIQVTYSAGTPIMTALPMQ